VLAACAHPSPQAERMGSILPKGSSDASVEASSDAAAKDSASDTGDGAVVKDGTADADDGARKITGTYTFTVDDSGASTKTGCFTETLPKVR
jgi:hypothetical protein